MSNFAFLRAEWPELHDAATRAESLLMSDPRTSCFHARRALELGVVWLYVHDKALKRPYEMALAALIHEPTFRDLVGPAVWSKTRVIKDVGNRAVHNPQPIKQYDALQAVKELFHFGFWIARNYARGARPADGLAFDQALVPMGAPVPAQTQAQLEKLAAVVAEKDAALAKAALEKTALDEELAKLRAEIAAAKTANTGKPDDHDYSEAETRDYFIDLLLKEAGWPLDKKQDREFEVDGMPNQKGKGYVDYVLWGDDGKPLGIVEAKRTRKDPIAGQQQAKLYADCLEKRFGQRPVIFCTNGYEHTVWDDARHPPRAVQGFLTKNELALAIQRRTSRRPLATTEIDRKIVGRPYQERAIRRITETFERDNQRKALIVMATGAGKTRTVVALADLLTRCNWTKRVLFLADRVALVNQAIKAFKQHWPASSPVNLVTEKDAEGRVYVSTYPTMMGLIDDVREGRRKFGVGHFDLIVIDEAHRSVYQKYRAIFDYFDSYLVGLTATPRDEIDRNTYGLFELQTGVPTDFYDLDDAVKDGYLVPARSVSVPLKFPREGIRYDELAEDEKDKWDAVEWSEDGAVPDHVEADAVNKWLFNKNTVDKVLAHLMTQGLKVAGGDRLGKTIVFAKNHKHAAFIVERFDASYPHHKGSFARLIDFQTEYAQTLIDDFSTATKPPHIAVSIDMLDTGIDVPEVLNLVFFKLVRSKTKFWQMLGRGTRLCTDVFGPGKSKELFFVFDFCGNLEYFNLNPRGVEGAAAESLGKRLFTTRIELIGELDRRLVKDAPAPAGGASVPAGEAKSGYDLVKSERGVREETADLLRTQVASMNVEGFVVRAHRRSVEKFAQPAAWVHLDDEAVGELVHEIAGLPTELADEDEEAKRFDLLVLRIELALLRIEPGFARLQGQVRSIAALLEEKSSIPMVRAELELILEVQTDEWWQDVTTPMLERMRKRLRALVKLIEKASRLPVYTDFLDEIGAATEIALPGMGPGTDYERFRAKARQFLRAHEDHVALQKLRMNRALTATDLAELERMLVDARVGTSADLDRAKAESEGLGLFIRSLVGLDREAAKQAFARFLENKTATANQIELINKIVDHLTERGVMDPALLYESPFTDVSPHGPEGVFGPSDVDNLVELLQEFRRRAAG